MTTDYLTNLRAFFILIGPVAARNGVAGAIVINAPFSRVRACDHFEAGPEAKFCKCTFSVHAHTRAARRVVHWCSQCGADFNRSYSHCEDHGKGAA